MPPTIRREDHRQVESMVGRPQRAIRSLASGQQGAYSGQVPGTSSTANQVGVKFSTLQQYPAPGTSPNGDQHSGVGMSVLNNSGNPAVVMGNLNAISGGASSNLPSSFQDGGFAFVDQHGNFVAGYSQDTGLFGFGSGGGLSPVSNWYGNIDHKAAYGNYFTIVPDGYETIDLTGASTQTWLDSSTSRIITPGVYVNTFYLSFPSGTSGFSGWLLPDTNYIISAQFNLADVAAFAAALSTINPGGLITEVYAVTAADISAGNNYQAWYMDNTPGATFGTGGATLQAYMGVYPLALA